MSMTLAALRHRLRNVLSRREVFPGVRMGWQARERNPMPLPGCYAIFHGSRLVYIGSAGNVKNRLSVNHKHFQFSWLYERNYELRVCYSRPHTFEHLSREARLISRLKPPYNVRHK